MIWHIICKETLESLLSLRFILSLLLIISLFTASGFIFVDKYKQQSQDYWKTTNENLAALNKQSEHLYNLPFYKHKIWRKPKPLALCVGGFERYLPNYFEPDVFRVLPPGIRTRSNFLLPQFCDIDWVFVTSMLLSFIALLLTYDSFCGEKQKGTLRLILSAAIPRHHVLFGKYFGALLTLAIPLMIGLLINLVIVVSSGIVELVALDWLKLLVIFLLSLLYLSLFLLLGMLVSSRTAQPANSMVILFFAWISLVILIPSLGRIISDIYYKPHSRAKINRKVNETLGQILRDMKADKFGKNASVIYSGRDHPSNNPPAAARFWNVYIGSVVQLRAQHHSQMLAQAFVGRNFASISPAVIYQRASEAIAGTGINRCVSLYQQIKRYQDELKEFVLTEDRKDPNSLHLLFPFSSGTKDVVAISKNPVDFDTVPKFQEQDLGIGKSLQLAIWDIGLLALFNLAFFAAAFVSFLKYDVR